MPTIFRQDPGPCPICGAAHTACTGHGPEGIVIDQLPARDALAATLPEPPQEVAADSEITTATYRGKKKSGP